VNFERYILFSIFYFVAFFGGLFAVATLKQSIVIRGKSNDKLFL